MNSTDPKRSAGTTPAGPKKVAPEGAGPVAPLAVAGLGLVGAGYFLRKLGKEDEALRNDFKAKLLGERNKDTRDELLRSQEKHDEKSGYELTFGTTAMLAGIGLVLAAIAVARAVRTRVALLWLAPALLVGSVYAVYLIGVESLVPASVLSFALIAYACMGPDERVDREAEAFRKLPMRLARRTERKAGNGTQPGERELAYRQTFLETEGGPKRLLKQVPALPTPFERCLLSVGEGRRVANYQLKKDLAFVSFVEADAWNVTDFTAVTMLLEGEVDDEKTTYYGKFCVRPFEEEAAKKPGWYRLPNAPELERKRLIEYAPRKGREGEILNFLTEEVRGELLSQETYWLFVDDSVMALVRYGRIDAEEADRLVEAADELFAMLGADGGPNLTEPDGVVKVTHKKKPIEALPEAAS